MQGLLLLDKPSGTTSFGAVAQVRRISGEKRAGHTGTLDPMATGVLPIFFGRATALAGLMLDADKRYTATVKLGVTTDTNDITGRVLSQSPVSVTGEEIGEALKKFTGRIMQRPPEYSALKKDGVRLYKLAREGKNAEIPEREVTVYEINRLSGMNGDNEFIIDTSVSKGTYIRALARDIGEYLGCGAVLSSLRRTFTGGFSIEDCVKLERIDSENIEGFIQSEEKAVEYLKAVEVTEKQAKRFCNGGQLSFERLKNADFAENELVRVKFENCFLGIGRADFEKEELAVKCVINYLRGEER